MGYEARDCRRVAGGAVAGEVLGTGLGTGPVPEIEPGPDDGPDAGPDAGPDPDLRPKRGPIAVGLTAGSNPDPWPIESGGNEGGGYLGPLVL